MASRNGLGDMAFYGLLRGGMRSWYRYLFAQSGTVPKPRDEPAVSSSASYTDRVLLIGNGPCHGWGVLTHQLSLPGQLCRAVQTLTRRPTAVDYVGDERMNIRSARAWVGERDLKPYDVVVIVMGVNDAVRLTPVKQWATELSRLLDFLLSETRPTVQVLVTGVQPVTSISAYSGPLGYVAERHARRLNAATRSVVAAHERVQFSDLSGQKGREPAPHGSSSMYSVWGSELAVRVEPLMALSPAKDTERAPLPASKEWQWPITERVVQLAKTGGSAELQRIAGLAQESFDVEFAVVTLIDGDRLWYAMNTHILPQSLPKELAYCRTTVEQDSLLVIPDADRDARFNTNPLVEMIGLPFYMGLPLHSRAGETIGTFCLLGARARNPEEVSLPLLRQLAGEAQAELWRIEAATGVETRLLTT